LTVYDHLAKPKPEFKPEPVKVIPKHLIYAVFVITEALFNLQKSSKIFSDFARLDDLASPKPYHLDPPKSLQVYSFNPLIPGIIPMKII